MNNHEASGTGDWWRTQPHECCWCWRTDKETCCVCGACRTCGTRRSRSGDADARVDLEIALGGVVVRDVAGT